MVDEEGKPVKGAMIVVDAGPPQGWEDLIASSTTDAQGIFIYRDIYCGKPVNRYRLYVTPFIEPDTLSPIDSPFRRVIGGNRAFEGRPIILKKKQDLDVGDVRVQIHYGIITVRLLNHRGQPLLNEPDDLQGFVYRVRDSKGAIISTLGLSMNDMERVVHTESSSIPFALPEGRWFLEVSLTGFDGPWLKADSPLEIVRGQSHRQVTLKMSHRGR